MSWPGYAIQAMAANLAHNYDVYNITARSSMASMIFNRGKITFTNVLCMYVATNIFTFIYSAIRICNKSYNDILVSFIKRVRGGWMMFNF